MKLERYSRQILYPNIGEKGQKRLLESKVVLIGCGALGSSSANLLVRAGIGHLTIVDRDRVEISNLQRQTLFNEEDARQNLPKAQAAQQRLATINSEITIESHMLDVHAGNIESLIPQCDLILDGTDNFEIRYLINDVSLKHNIPWIYGGCVQESGFRDDHSSRPNSLPSMRIRVPAPRSPGNGRYGRDYRTDSSNCIGSSSNRSIENSNRPGRIRRTQNAID